MRFHRHKWILIDKWEVKGTIYYEFYCERCRHIIIDVHEEGSWSKSVI